MSEYREQFREFYQHQHGDERDEYLRYTNALYDFTLTVWEDADLGERIALCREAGCSIWQSRMTCIPVKVQDALMDQLYGHEAEPIADRTLDRLDLWSAIPKK